MSDNTPTPPPDGTDGGDPGKHGKKQNGEGPWIVYPLLPVPPHVPQIADDNQRKALALVELRYASGLAGLLKESYDALIKIIEPG